MDLAQWLTGLNLAQYIDAFARNDVDGEVLLELGDDDLEKIGIGSLGHRKRLLKAINALRANAVDAPPAPTAVAARPEAERRQLTVMFCDLVGSTALAERLDPEDLRDVIRAYQDACAGVVSRFEGYVAKYIGDGLLVYFGYPHAHEDDAERAIRSGLGILSAVGALQTKTPEPLAVRVGIATGMVVVGDIIGEGTAQEKAVVGETPNLAARLQGIADPNAIVISAATRDLSGGQFEYEDLGPQALKGISKPVRAWRVTGERATETRFHASRSAHVAALIGREQERELLLERWRRAASGEGQLALLSGEAGIGKSRITEALRQQIKSEDRWSVHYQCSPHHANSPLYPVVQQLQFAAGIERADTNTVKLGKIEALLQQSNATGQLRFIAALLSVDAGARGEPLSLTPLEQKQQTLKALIGLFEGLSVQRPVLLVLEDAHWMDPTTRELMDIVVDRVSGLKAMVLVTHRPEFSAPWTRYPHCTVLALNRLTRTACASLINEVTGGRALPSEVLDQIVLKSDGVPLFVEELTKTVLESGLLERRNGAYALGGPLPPLAIPSTLQDSLMARLDRLNGAKEIAQIGASIGREFSHALIEAVSPLRGASLTAALETLRQSEIIFRRGEPPNATYVFRHALIQDTAYDSLLRARRQQIHARIAQVLKATGDVEPEVIAHHFTYAGLDQEAAPEWLQAGQRAVARSANLEAIAHLTRGLDAVRTLPATAAARDIELDMQVSLGSAQIAARGYSAAETAQAYARARELVTATPNDGRTFAVLHGLGLVYWNRAQMHELGAVAADMLARANRQNERLPVLVAHRLMAPYLNATGQFATALEHAEQAVSLYDPQRDHESAHVFGHDQGVGALWHRAIAQLFLGKGEEFIESARRAEELAATLKHANTTLYSGLWSAFTSIVREDWERARSTASEMIEDGAKRSMALWVVFGRHHLGCALAGLRQAEAALEEIHRGRSAAEALEHRILKPMTLCFEGRSLAALGRYDLALQRLTEGLAVVQETGERWWEAELHRARGEVMREAGRARAECDDEFRRAIEIASRQGATFLVARASARLSHADA